MEPPSANHASKAPALLSNHSKNNKKSVNTHNNNNEKDYDEDYDENEDDDEGRGDGDFIALPNDFSVMAVSTAARSKAQPITHQVESVLAKKVNLSQRARSDVAFTEREAVSKNQGRDDRATTEQVMDPRTRLILFKMLSRGLFEEIHGCVSTGKEANVYHATSPSQELAVKVFKTSILVFRELVSSLIHFLFFIQKVEGTFVIIKGSNQSLNSPRSCLF